MQTMNSLRRWLYRPKRSDSSLLAQFYFADEELNLIATELDGLEGRKDPERCAILVTQLRASQARVLNIVSQIMDESIKDRRALRDFRVKFPDDVIQENLSGQLWFGAECLAAGSSIMNREVESAFMRPLARALTKSLDSIRTILREQCLRSVDEYTDYIKENLIVFDKLFAEFELSYVSAMVSVKTAHEYDMIQEITVLFSETVQRALKLGLLSQEMIDEYDPALMFTIPRLAIVCGVLIFKDGPLNPDNEAWNISEMFRPFQTLLVKIRELLSILSAEELNTLERSLCRQEEPSFLVSLEEKRKQARDEKRRQKREKKANSNLNKNRTVSDGDNGSIESELTAMEIAERLEALASNFEATHNTSALIGAEAGNGGSDETNSDDSPSNDIEDINLHNGSSNQQNTDLTVHLGRVEDFYLEANLDSSQLLSASTHAFSRRDLNEGLGVNPELIVQGIRMAPNIVHNRSHVHVPRDRINFTDLESVNPDTSDNLVLPNEVGEALEEDELLHDQTKFSLNKCDSSDSGLQSEVVSNSGSMFTISSSDSNQQILSSESVPRTSEQNSNDCKECVETHNSSSSSDPDSSRKFEHSSDSSATIVSPSVNEGWPRDLSPDKSEEQSAHSSESMNNIEKSTDLHNEASESITSSDSLPTYDGCLPNQTNANNVQDITCHDGAVAKDSDSDQKRTSNDMLRHSKMIETCDKSEVNNEVKCDNNVEENIALNESNIDQSDVNISFAGLRSDVEDYIHDDINECVDCFENEEAMNVKSVDSNEDSHTVSSTVLSEQGASSSLHRPQSNSSPVLVASEAPAVEITDAAAAATSSTDSPHSNTPPASNCTHKESEKKSGKSKGASAAKNKAGGKRKSKKSTGRCRKHDSSAHRCHVRDQRASAEAMRNKMMMDCHRQLESEILYHSSETSSYTSECGDEEEIALAITASRNNVRARFKNSSDMIHRLFVCISGVADQLQTNFAGDLRNILRSVFDMNCPDPVETCENEKTKDTTPLGATYRAMSHASRAPRHRHSSLRRDPPTWLPDDQSNECMACQVPFNFIRRRHHCRNCGKIFCSRCSSNSVPLPHFGQEKAVRVCNRCYMFRVTPFTE